MKKVKLSDLVGKDVTGILANVTLHGDAYEDEKEPMIRNLKRVYLKTEKRKQWLYWEWEPQPEENHRIGHMDCGYSGIADSKFHRISEVWIYAEVN